MTDFQHILKQFQDKADAELAKARLARCKPTLPDDDSRQTWFATPIEIEKTIVITNARWVLACTGKTLYWIGEVVERMVALNRRLQQPMDQISTLVDTHQRRVGLLQPLSDRFSSADPEDKLIPIVYWEEGKTLAEDFLLDCERLLTSHLELYSTLQRIEAEEQRNNPQEPRK